MVGVGVVVGSGGGRNGNHRSGSGRSGSGRVVEW